MSIFKKIKTLYKVIGVDIDLQIDEVNRACQATLSEIKEENGYANTEMRRAYDARLKKLIQIGKTIGIAAEINPWLTKEPSIEGDLLENRLRCYMSNQYSLFWACIASAATIASLIIACASLLLSIVSLLLALC
jgi:hypothetical protein